MDGLSGTERLRAHLADLPGGIGCRHLARERDGLDAGLLVDLGLVKPIVSRVPRCTEHRCPLVAGCAYRPDFEPEASGAKAGVKYRPTAAGVAAAFNNGVIRDAVRGLPAAAALIDLLAEGPATVFALHGRFVERARAAARSGERADIGVLNRVTLGATLGLLVDVGTLKVWDDEMTYARPDDVSEADPPSALRHRGRP